MVQHKLKVFLCISVLFATSVAFGEEQHPWQAGPVVGTSYCASVLTLASVKFTFDTTSVMDVSGTLQGNSTVCHNEAYTYDSTTRKISLTNLLKPTDCVNQVFTKLGQDPTSVNTYWLTNNSVQMTGPLGNLTLTEAACNSFLPQLPAQERPGPGAHDKRLAPDAAPSGKYCGSILSLASVKVDIISSSSANVDGTVAGSTSSCSDEPYTYDASTGTMTLTKLLEPTDCVYQVFLKLGQNPKDVKVHYDAAANAIDLTLPLGNLTLTPAGCNPIVVVRPLEVIHI